MISLLKDKHKRIILSLSVSGIALIASFFFARRLAIDPAWIAILLCGIPIIKGATVALVTELDIKADLLVALALVASIVIGEAFAAGEVAFIMILGAMLEERTAAKARAGIEKLLQLTPRTARVVREDEEVILLAEQVRIGDALRVLAGETIAVDGVIVEGQTSVDQSVMTGESLPVDKRAGDEVLSGTVNQFGSFLMRASKVGEDSSLQRMIRLVASADAGKAKIVGIADRWATWIVGIALSAAGFTWFITGEVIRAVTILVVFCPCALVLATPTAIMAGIGNATKHGILVREGGALERLAQVTHVAFDKTGTLTHGKPAVASIEICGNISADALLELTASAERRSEHPLGKAITAHYRKQKSCLPTEPEEFCLIPGRGVEAVTAGWRVIAGNAEMLADANLGLPYALLTKANAEKNLGRTVIFVAIDDQVAGFIALADALREDAAQVIREIQDIGVETLLLTGDNQQAAQYAAAQAGISEVRAECLPETKLETIARYQRAQKRVCMIGDGVNDAPALKAAHVAIAMGGIGSDIAIEAADIALVSDDIRHLPHLLRLARKTMGKIRVNLIASMALNFAAISLAMTGLLNPVVGALVHNAGSVVVVINSSLLLRWKRKMQNAADVADS